ncbi:hypothetical protein HF1_10100 [Mycoplasma haemofelis str. Langford 1]|uniref:Uncharacterized protein n=1 Tax=Mycoplasma haemofelis (strain Langford 1) TaxID=941640 RepID=E8ZIP7_MYCHL|nr:hypothetical protein [Mycoplasma haemofelis]CBY93018.1 hypothetical protein HF1_10100 [Mycoplasma haemofelis str. Langford 1]
MNHLYTLAGAGALGAASGGAYLIHNSISKTSEPTLRSRLEKEHYSVMDPSDGNWTTVLSKYKEAGVLADKKFSDLSGEVTDQSLKQKCNSVLSSGDSSLYEKAKLWCTVPRTIQQRLEDLKITLLKTTGDDENGDKTNWNKLKDKYQKATSDQKIKDFTIATPSADNAWQSLRTECAKHLSKDRWDAEYDYFLDKVTTWCSSKLLNE